MLKCTKLWINLCTSTSLVLKPASRSSSPLNFVSKNPLKPAKKFPNRNGEGYIYFLENHRSRRENLKLTSWTRGNRDRQGFLHPDAYLLILFTHVVNHQLFTSWVHLFWVFFLSFKPSTSKVPSFIAFSPFLQNVFFLAAKYSLTL